MKNTCENCKWFRTKLNGREVPRCLLGIQNIGHNFSCNRFKDKNEKSEKIFMDPLERVYPYSKEKEGD